MPYSDSVLVEAIDLFFTAGRAELILRSHAEHRSAWMDIRRHSLAEASQRIADVFGVPSAYEKSGFDIPPVEVPEGDLGTVRGDYGNGYAEACEWAAKSLVLLQKCAAIDKSERITSPLLRSVLRPLCIEIAKRSNKPRREVAEDIGVLYQTHAARSSSDVSAESCLIDLIDTLDGARNGGVEIMEALAALIRLSSGALSSSPQLKGSLASFKESLPCVRIVRNGPYITEGNAEVTDYLGVPIETLGCSALCRCGGSRSQPFCDGSHAIAGFTEAKDPRRVADSRDEYEGQQLKVLDNRGLCAHSGFCTDRLAPVFHLGQEPFVAPSGARMDEILQAVRRCPSGALGAAVDNKEMREFVDRSRTPEIEISRNGPYRLRGSIPVLDDQGAAVPRNEGASEEHCSLCRCGSSLNKPFCSGMHWSVNFTDPVMPADHEHTLFEWAGGYPAILDMTTIFYSRHVPADPIIGPLFARMEADHPERVASWLCEVFGGPSFYSERYGGYARMISQHLDKHLTQEQRSHWARLMAQSADEAGLPTDPEFRAAFMAYIEWGSRIAVENSTAGAKPPEGMPVPKWWWVCNALPAARVSAMAPEVEQESAWSPEPLKEDESPSFEKHIKPLFRPMDRASMKFVFDLWSHEDVTKHAEAILSRVRAGTMPCDGAWSSEKVELFDQWVRCGKGA